MWQRPGIITLTADDSSKDAGRAIINDKYIHANILPICNSAKQNSISDFQIMLHY